MYTAIKIVINITFKLTDNVHTSRAKQCFISMNYYEPTRACTHHRLLGVKDEVFTEDKCLEFFFFFRKRESQSAWRLCGGGVGAVPDVRTEVEVRASAMRFRYAAVEASSGNRRKHKWHDRSTKMTFSKAKQTRRCEQSDSWKTNDTASQKKGTQIHFLSVVAETIKPQSMHNLANLSGPT